MEPAQRHQPASANIAHEAFEEEVVVVNLMLGKYYALQGEAADIWRLAIAGTDFRSICEQMGRSYSAEPAVIHAGVATFLEKLVSEEILAPAQLPPEAPAPAPLPIRGVAFKTPTFEIHDDLQDLLLLDPVHEVDAAGWPVMKPEQGQDVR